MIDNTPKNKKSRSLSEPAPWLGYNVLTAGAGSACVGLVFEGITRGEQRICEVKMLSGCRGCVGSLDVLQGCWLLGAGLVGGGTFEFVRRILLHALLVVRLCVETLDKQGQNVVVVVGLVVAVVRLAVFSLELVGGFAGRGRHDFETFDVGRRDSEQTCH